MLVLIDESGCAGFKQGSSTNFVLAMIIFNSFEDAEQAANMIKRLKQEISPKREFKFSSCDNQKRDKFFEAIRSAKFGIKIFNVEKRLIQSTALRKNDEMFVNYCLKNLLKMAQNRIINAVFKIDGKGSR